MAKILIVEIDKESEDKMIESFCNETFVNLNCKVIEMHKNIESYENHIKEEKKELRVVEEF